MQRRTFLGMISASALAGGAGVARAEAGKTRLAVMSFNVLCSFCDRANYDSWEDRLHYMKDIFTRHNPDLIGLQEISKAEEVGQINDLVPQYKSIYYEDPPGPKAKAYPDATILYRADRFDVIEKGTIWLSKEPDKPWSKGWAKAAFWRLVAWAHLKDKKGGRELFFATTHFDNNQPNQPMSAPLMLQRIEPWAGRMPCIFVGDFNSKPDSPAYATLTKGVDGKGFKLANAFDLAKSPGADPKEFPAGGWSPESRIDHIFLAGKADFAVSRWTADLHTYGPNNRFPSDHRAISADIDF